MFARIRITSRSLLAVLLAYWAVLFLGTHLPGGTVRSDLNLDKPAHFAAYAGLAYLAALFFDRPERPLVRLAMLVLAALAAYGALDEWSQGPIPGRHPDVRDWVADVAGAGAGLAAFCLARRRRGNPATGSDAG